MHALLCVCSRLKELALLSHSQLVAGIVARSCSLALSILLFSPTHNVFIHKKLILHLRAFMRLYIPLTNRV